MSVPSEAIDLHFTVDGPPKAPTIVLSHALGAAMEMWDPQMAALLAQFRVVRYDHRGHGKSPVPPGPYRLEDLGRDTLRLLDRLELQRVAFCGLSLGGMVGMWLGLNAPERLERLVLCCTAARMLRPDDYAARAWHVREKGMASIAPAVLGRWFPPGFATDEPATLDWIRGIFVATPPEGYAGACEALAAMDLRSDLSRIRTPTLVIAGASDQATPVQQSRDIARQIRRSKLVVIPEASHLANVVKPDAFSDQLLRYLRAA